MKDLNFKNTLQLADTSVSEMFSDKKILKEETPISAIGKIKMQKNFRNRVNEKREVLEARFKVTDIIYNEYHRLAIPRMGMKPGVMYFNPMLAFYIEGTLEDNLLKTQGRL